jgi:hypothetical protein
LSACCLCLQHLEDRQNVALATPLCYKSQLSQLINSSVSPSGDSIIATWTRPMALPSALSQEGFLNITSGPTPLISALLAGPPPSSPYISCFPVLSQHSSVGQVTAAIVPVPAPSGSYSASVTPSPSRSLAAVSASPSPAPFNPHICVDVGSCTMTLDTSLTGDGNLTFTGTCSTPGSPMTWCECALCRVCGLRPCFL